MMGKTDTEVKHDLRNAPVTGFACLLQPANAMNNISEYGTHRESLQVVLAPPQPLPSSPPIAKGATAKAVHRRLRTCHFDRAPPPPPFQTPAAKNVCPLS